MRKRCARGKVRFTRDICFPKLTAAPILCPHSVQPWRSRPEQNHMLVATDTPGWAKPCFLHIGYVEEDRNHGVWCGGVPVFCLVPGTLRRSGIRSSQPEDLPLIVSPASGASRHIVLHSSTSLRISSHDVRHTHRKPNNLLAGQNACRLRLATQRRSKRLLRDHQLSSCAARCWQQPSRLGRQLSPSAGLPTC